MGTEFACLREEDGADHLLGSESCGCVAINRERHVRPVGTNR
jgi:hypothetical protein